MLPRRRIILLITVIALVAIVIVGTLAYVRYIRPVSQAADEINFMKSFLAAPPDVPYDVAIDKGYFANYHLRVNIISNPSGSAAAIRSLASGGVDFAEGDIGTLMVLMARESITNVKAVDAYYQHNPGGVIFLKGKGISQPKDLEGKTVGSFAGNSVEFLFPLFARASGLNVSAVHIQHIAAASLQTALLSNQVDAILTFAFHTFDFHQVSQTQVGNFSYRDYGVDTYANSILTRTDIIARNPDLVSRFVKALEDARSYSVAHPDEAVQSFLKINPQYDPTISLAIWRDWTISVMGGKDHILALGKPTSIGWFDPSRMASTTEIIHEAYGIPNIDSSSLYTSQFVTSS